MKSNIQCLEKHHAMELIQLKNVNLGRGFLYFFKKDYFLQFASVSQFNLVWDQIYELEQWDEKEIAECWKTGQEVMRQTVSI